MLLGAMAAAHGQLVSPKTVPIRQDDQFAIFPSARAGMGGLSIALDDSLADPFVNPAKAWMAGKGMVFTAPFDHTITGGHGGGRTLPLGGVGSLGDWAGSFVVAWQDLNHSASSNALNIGASDNRYTQFGLTRRFPNDLSVGASVYYARLHALDGVDLLYDGSDGIAQKGSLSDVRLGMTKEWGEKRLEVLLVGDRTNITNAVEHVTVYEGSRQTYSTYQIQHDFDRTNTWGAQAQYVQPIGDGWRFGWTATANRMTHPNVPNYVFKNTPTVWFDPGGTNAFNFGMGLARTRRHTTYGFDFVIEPINTSTWGDAQSDTLRRDGTTLRAGEHTVDNQFRFTNSKFRAGLQQDIPIVTEAGTAMLGLQLGLSVYSVDYQLDQRDNVAQERRQLGDQWREWSPTYGLNLRMKHATVQYTFRATCSRDCVQWPSGDKVTVPGTTIVAAPTRFVHVDGGTSRVHQLQVTVPLY